MNKFFLGWMACYLFFSLLELFGVLGKTLSEIGFAMTALYIAIGIVWYFAAKAFANWAGRSKK